ncbi:MAG TPA: hypothetical protein VNO21_10495, partial [Polyangiaceae bacterium]|nr:hypothetical protein [Polyangiaceae bacterium]
RVPASVEEGGTFASAVDGFVAVAWDAIRARVPSGGGSDGFELDLDTLAASLQTQIRALL